MNASPGTSKLVLVVAFLALGASVAALGGVAYLAFYEPKSDTPNGRLDKYDFSTPEAALKSDWQMELNGDHFARMELQRRLNSKIFQQMHDSVEVRHTKDWRDKKVLFISFELPPGNKRYQAKIFEKNPFTGYWVQSTAASNQMQQENPELIQQMLHWERTGMLDLAAEN